MLDYRKGERRERGFVPAPCGEGHRSVVGNYAHSNLPTSRHTQARPPHRPGRHCAIPEMVQEQKMTEQERFIEESRFAKVVETKDGPALLICGQVINVQSANPEHADWLSRVLRRPNRALNVAHSASRTGDASRQHSTLSGVGA